MLSKTSLTAWRGSLTVFDGFFDTHPAAVFEMAAWEKIATTLAPASPAVLKDKKHGKYVVPCLLKVAPLVGKTLEVAQAAGASEEGKQRSANHVTQAALLIIDCDGLDGSAFANAIGRIEEDGLTILAYTTHSNGDANKPGVRARLALPLDRPLSAAEYKKAWHGFDATYLDGMAGKTDPSGSSLCQQQGCWCCHPERESKARKLERQAGVASADALIAACKDSGGSVVAHSVFGSNLFAKAAPATPENVARVHSALAEISADVGYDKWHKIVWAIASTDWDGAEDIAREWSMTAPGKYHDAEFGKVWHSFNPAGGISLGTLFHFAREAGWQDDVAEPTTGDIKNGKAFAEMFRGKLLFVYETNDMLQFSSQTGWIQAKPGEADRAGKTVVAEMRAKAAEQWKLNPDDPKVKRLMKHVDQSSTAPKIDAMISMAKSEPGMTVQLNELDADTMMLGVTNGVLDLHTGQLLAPSPALLVTKRCPVPYDPGATSPILESFIARITRGDPPLAQFLQRVAGYILTGEVREQCFIFLHGLGRNGKTTYAELLHWLLGEYAAILPTATLMMGKRDPGAASPDLMLLKGRRLALASELEENARFAEAAIKSMTGGDTLTARNPYGTFASWRPTHKLMIVGNHKPVISGGDHGIWRRVRLIPFAEKIGDAECDGRLPVKLRTEGAGVLNWALAGLRQWQREGLNPPASVKDAVAAYQTDMDILGQWMDDHVLDSPGTQTPTATLYRAYEKWSRESGWKNPMTRNAFGRRLVARNIPIVKAGGGNKCAKGIALNLEGQRAAAYFG